MGVAGVVLDVAYSLFTKEVAEQNDDAPGCASFLAHITWFLWVVAGTTGLLAAATLARRRRPGRRIPFFLGRAC